MAVQIPSREVVDDIKTMPKFDADISQFAGEGMDIQQIADWITAQEGQVVLNISQASSEEREKLAAVEAELKYLAPEKLVLFDEAAKVDEITEQITRDVVFKAIESFREFIRRALGDSNNFITEWNKYVATRKDEGGFETLHYWNNIGLADPRNPLRMNVMGVLETLGTEFEGDIKMNVFPRLDPNENITVTRSKIDTLLLGMLSNMVRGVFYNYANAKKVYDMRKLAVDTLRDQGQLADAA